MDFLKQLINLIMSIFGGGKKSTPTVPPSVPKTDIPKPETPKPETPKPSEPTTEEIPATEEVTPSNTDDMNQKQKTLYALIVGINDYQFVGKLGGCVNDANRINEYLEKVTKQGDFVYAPAVLTDAAATRQNIIAHFNNHLAKAEADDVALFYFSGHGAQERGDSVWTKTDPDGALETMVCYDSRDPKGTPDLADKELRYLIHKVAKNNPHIVVISDSCHSGDNTRSELVKRRLPLEEEVAEPRLSGFSPMRTWDKFCFSHEVSPSDVAAVESLEAVLPQGRHIQLAACRDRELAYELRGSGIFTGMLLNVLERSSGNISYLDLWQRIRFSITGKYPQLPQVYASSGDAVELHAEFLGGAAVKEPYYYNVQHNFRSLTGWNLSIGGIHGMPSAAAAKALRIEIRDANEPSKIITTASVKSVEPGMTTLSIANEALLDKEAQYLATIPDLFTDPVKVYLHGDAAGVKMLEQRINADADFQYSNLAVTQDLVLADYLVYAKKGQKKDYYFIGQPLDNLGDIDKEYRVKFPGDSFESSVPHWKWLTEQQEGFTPGSADEVIKFLKVAANWHFVRKLRNQGTQLTQHGVEVIVKQVPHQNMAQAKVLEFEDGVEEVEFDSKNNPITYFSISVKNNSNKTYQVALPALFVGFEVVTEVLAGGTTELKPGETKQAFGGIIPSISLSDTEETDEQNWWIKEFNWREKTWYLKLIVSTEPFSIADFARAALPLPKATRSSAGSRGFGNVGTVTTPPASDWTTETFEIRMLNPFFVSK